MRIWAIVTAPVRITVRICKGIVKNGPALGKVLTFKLKSFMMDAIPLISSVGTVVTLRYWLTNDPSKFSTSDEIYQAMGGQFVMASLTSPGLQKVGRNISKNFLPTTMINPYLRKRQEFGQKFEVLREHISESHCQAIEGLLKKWDLNMEDNFTGPIDTIEKRLESLTAMPYKRNPPVAEEDFHARIVPKIEALIKNYPEEFQDKIKDYVADIMDNINEPESFDKENPNLRVMPLFLVGAAGVGKTRLIAQLANILDLAYFRYKVTPKQSQEEIEGSIFYNLWDHPKPGIIMSALSAAQRSHKSRCCIIFLDELDKAFPQKNPQTQTPQDSPAFLKSWLLDLFNESIFKSIAYDAMFDISNIYVVVATNRDFVEDFDMAEKEAFVTRRHILFVPPLGPQAKLNIGLEEYEKLLKLTEDHHQKNPSQFPSRSIFKEEHEKMIREIIQRNTFDGVRVMLNVIRSYVRHVKKQKYYRGFKKAQFDIEAKYKYYQLKEQKAKMNEDSVKQEVLKEAVSEKRSTESKEKMEHGVSKSLMPQAAMIRTGEVGTGEGSSFTEDMLIYRKQFPHFDPETQNMLCFSGLGKTIASLTENIPQTRDDKVISTTTIGKNALSKVNEDEDNGLGLGLK